MEFRDVAHSQAHHLGKIEGVIEMLEEGQMGRDEALDRVIRIMGEFQGKATKPPPPRKPPLMAWCP